MNLNNYQSQIVDLSKNYKDISRINTFAFGLCEEVGEVAALFKRYYRNENNSNFTTDLTKELGDILAYLSLLANEYDISLENIANSNLEKISKRVQNKTILGSGSER